MKKILTFLILIIIVIAAYVAYKNRTVPSVKDDMIPANEPISITQQKISEDNFTGEIPFIVGYGPLADAAREYVQNALSDFRTWANDEVPGMRVEFGAGSPPATYSITMKATRIVGPKTESIIFDNYEYTGGANGMSTYAVFTASIATGELLPISKVISGDKQDEFVAYVKQKLLDWKPEGMEETPVFPEDVAKLSMDSFKNSSLDEQNLTIYFNKYEIGPGALGAVAFPLPLAEIQQYLAI